ncbi:MAG: aspartate kinase, partial [Proteobacteria bacterium]|nr:aspartate kinase [Pseudomonadota bacterium]
MSTKTAEAAFEDSAALGAPQEIAESRWVVMKFGGSSVSSAAHWATIAGLVRARIDAGLAPIVVHSALRGVSNSLEETLEAAVRGDPGDRLDRIRRQHYELAEALELDGAALLEDRLHELDQLIAGVRLVREVSVRVRVRVMALGELLATRLGAAYLERRGLPVRWMDARDLLTSRTRPGRSPVSSYLSATCAYEHDPAMEARIAKAGGIVVTQGFIARNASGETVLLGRGGSDTSAAYFAARVRARRLEVWTDVPGMFSADPRVVPSARLLVALRYDEAQELASAGSSVLHPRCISPAREGGIPIFIRSTANPE